jgi:hypothetical protein
MIAAKIANMKEGAASGDRHWKKHNSANLQSNDSGVSITEAAKVMKGG